MQANATCAKHKSRNTLSHSHKYQVAFQICRIYRGISSLLFVALCLQGVALTALAQRTPAGAQGLVAAGGLQDCINPIPARRLALLNA